MMGVHPGVGPPSDEAAPPDSTVAVVAPDTTVPSVPDFADLAIYDDVLPSSASPFRTLEYGHYLDFFRSSVIVSLEASHFGFAHAGFDGLRASLPIEERLKDRVFGPDLATEIVPRLAYVTFLGNAQWLLPYFEARRIPFIFQLYPGGSFELNVEASDRHLRAVALSPLCRKIIATQTLTREYLLKQIVCDPAKIEFIYGGVFDSRVNFDFDRDKHFFGIDKDTIDLCFVAHRYGNDVTRKGYDQFVTVARILAARDPRLRFHVVGDYEADDVPLGDAAARFTFHGYQPSVFFADFYPRMDIILSANGPANPEAGAFDGFPTGACMEAGFRGVLNCISDPLHLNVTFEDGRDIVLIDNDPSRTAQRLASLFAAPDQLYALARANWERFRAVFDIDRQLWARTKLITAELLREEVLVTRPAAPLSVSMVDRGADDWERRHDALLVAYRKLEAALPEVNLYGERRHDALLADYRKLASGYEAVLVQHRTLQAEYDALMGEPERPQAMLQARYGALAKLAAAHMWTRLARIAYYMLPGFVQRRRGKR
jgi:glycosyltransferase involved in cell wall biosynthesis